MRLLHQPFNLHLATIPSLFDDICEDPIDRYLYPSIGGLDLVIPRKPRVH